MIGERQVEVATAQVKRCPQRSHLLQQWLRGIEIAAQGRFAGAQDTGFESHAFAGIAQPLGMVQADVGDQRQVGVDQVDRIQAPAKADFQHREVQPGALEQPEGGQRPFRNRSGKSRRAASTVEKASHSCASPARMPSIRTCSL